MLNSSSLTRRTFAASAAASGLAGQSSSRPNILWLVSEDIGPQLGAYGDKYANTPNLDRFAGTALRYDHCWSVAPVCAPARTCIISGVYPPSLGGDHMRSSVRLPAGFQMFPQYLRGAGYYCSNNAKEDYNLEKPGQVWDDSSSKAHWRKRAAGQPFFAVFNFGITHESQVLRRRENLVHDPAQAPLPAYYPDTPEVRRDIAQYYDNITTMDGQVAQVLAELEADGLAEDTIVFFYGDNGRCLPRGKRMPYDSGLHVPLMVRVPAKHAAHAPAGYRAGGSTRRLVSFVDLAPTVLNVAGVKAPAWYQGRAFLGPNAGAEAQFIHGFRGRMDERIDLMRATRDQRYVYVRNYLPHRKYGEHVTYQWQQASMRDWDRLAQEGRLNAAQKHFWETKPHEELYDLQADPDEVNNLAASPAHRATLEKLRRAQDAWMGTIHDTGFLPEPEMRARAEISTPYELGHDAQRYAYARIKRAADLAAGGRAAATAELVKLLAAPDAAIRYWAATGLLIRQAAGITAGAVALRKALEDAAPSVRIAAAEALGRYGAPDDRARAARVLLAHAAVAPNGPYVATFAWNAIDQLPLDTLRSLKPELAAIDAGPPTGFATPPTGAAGARGAGRGPAVPGSVKGTFDLGGGGGNAIESPASRNAGGASNLKARVLAKLTP